MAWKLIKELTTNKSDNAVPCNNLDVNDINNFFSNLGSNAIKDLPSVDNYVVQFPTNLSSFIFENFTVCEVEQVFHSLRCTNSFGHDGLFSKLANCFIDCISHPLACIFNKSVYSGIMPHSMKIARVVPIFKSGDKSKLINYRPISVLSVFSKLFEKLIYNRMLKFVNKYKLLAACQDGFRSAHSTSHAIIDLINSVTWHIGADDKVAGLFIDISKAFDSLNHTILLQKMAAYGSEAFFTIGCALI
jgi:hypothetical protein